MPDDTDPEVPYEDGQAMNLDDHLKAFIWAKEGDVWIYSGPCPRCRHDVRKRFSTTTVWTFEEGRVKDEDRTMRCDCSEPHVGRPPGSRGCGAWWGLALTPR